MRFLRKISASISSWLTFPFLRGLHFHFFETFHVMQCYVEKKLWNCISSPHIVFDLQFFCLLFLLLCAAVSESCFPFQSLFSVLLCTFWTLFYDYSLFLHHTFHNIYLSHIHFAKYFVGEVIRFDANVKSCNNLFINFTRRIRYFIDMHAN